MQKYDKDLPRGLEQKNKKRKQTMVVKDHGDGVLRDPDTLKPVDLS